MVIHDMRYYAKEPGQPADDDEALLTASQVSHMTGVPVSTLHEYAVRVETGLQAQGPIHVRLGPRRRRWIRRDVTAWINENRVVSSCSALASHVNSLTSRL